MSEVYKSVFWLHHDVMHEARVPTESVQMAAGATCPWCPGDRITSINFAERTYQCTAIPGDAHHAMPRSIFRIDGADLIQQTRHAGDPVVVAVT